MRGYRCWSRERRDGSTSFRSPREPIDEATLSNEIVQTSIDLLLKRGEIFDEGQGAIDRLRFGLGPQQGLGAIDTALVDEEVLAASDRRH